MPLIPGAQSYKAIYATGGKVFVASENELCVFDPRTKKILSKGVLPAKQVDIALGLHTDGLLYGLTLTGVYSVNPKDYVIKEAVRSPVFVTCGFALNRNGIFFGSHEHLWVYRW